MQHSTLTALHAMPLTMEAYRVAAFHARVVKRIHESTTFGQTPEAIIAKIAAEQRALAAVITDPSLVAVAGKALVQAQAAICVNPRYHSTPEHAHESMQQIMKRRGTEAEQFANMLSRPAYVNKLMTLSSEEAQAAVPPLRDVKMADSLNDLLHLENGAPQVIAHIDATAKGAMLEHDALAIVFAPDGVLHDALVKGLANQLPQSTREDIHRIAATWLGDREAAAKLTSELSSNEGAAYIEAVRQSTTWHRATYNAMPAATLPATTVTSAMLETKKSMNGAVKEKNAQKRAEDVAYTINHALSCGATDVFLQPAIAAAFGVNTGCNADGLPHAKQKLTLKTFAHEAGHYLKGEIIGDFAAVPLTIAVQRFFPSFMDGIRKLTEPLFGWAFRGGANRTAQHWAKEHGMAVDAPEVKAYAAQIYEHEISHLPQAVVWNMFAYPIGAIGQKMGGHDRSYPEIFKSKLVGTVISNGLLIGGRILAPGAAQKWDQMTGNKIFAPISKTVGKLFGADEETIKNATNKQRVPAPREWTKRAEDRQVQVDGAAIQ